MIITTSFLFSYPSIVPSLLSFKISSYKMGTIYLRCCPNLDLDGILDKDEISSFFVFITRYAYLILKSEQDKT